MGWWWCVRGGGTDRTAPRERNARTGKGGRPSRPERWSPQPADASGGAAEARRGWRRRHDGGGAALVPESAPAVLRWRRGRIAAQLVWHLHLLRTVCARRGRIEEDVKSEGEIALSPAFRTSLRDDAWLDKSSLCSPTPLQARQTQPKGAWTSPLQASAATCTAQAQAILPFYIIWASFGFRAKV